MNRAISGWVAVLENGRPLQGLTVMAGRLLPDGVQPLGWTLSGAEGRFRIQYPPLSEPADLVLYLFEEDGSLLYVEPPHRLIAGAELNLRVEVPLARLADGLHQVRMHLFRA